MKQTKGIHRHLLFIINNEMVFGAPEVKNDTSPLKFIKYHPLADDRPDCFLHKAMNLAEMDVVHETFGLTLLDLLQMDYSFFSLFEKRVFEIIKHRKEVRDKEEAAAKAASSLPQQ